MERPTQRHWCLPVGLQRESPTQLGCYCVFSQFTAVLKNGFGELLQAPCLLPPLTLMLTLSHSISQKAL